MKVAIRADASIDMGSGHVMRCLTLADELAQRGATIQFICREHKGHLRQLIQERGYTVSLLPLADKLIAPSMPAHSHWIGAHWQQDAEQSIATIKDNVDWLIVDHYGLDARWHKQLRERAEKIMVIDDLADRELDCDLLLDQTLDRRQTEYRKLLDKDSCTVLTGSQYTLLREQFIAARLQKLSANKTVSDKINNLLISMGSNDTDNLSLQLLSLLQSIDYSGKVDIVLSSQAPHLGSLQKYAAKNTNVQLLCDVSQMAELINRADLIIGAAGTSNWERCCLGTPSIIFILASNQRAIATAMQKHQAAKVVDACTDNWQLHFQQIFNHLLGRKVRAELARNSQSICDGTGTRLVAQHLTTPCIRDNKPVTLRKAQADDVDIMFEWQCEPQIRRFARNSNPPEWEAHQIWFTNKLLDPRCFFFVIEHSRTAAGVVRLDWQYGLQYEVSILIAPLYQKCGLASAALALLRSTLAEIDILAFVKSDNQPSRQLFTKAGYQRIDSENFLSPAIRKIS